MAKFLTPLCDHQIGVRLWELDANLDYKSELYGSIISVLKKFQTDYESCPVWLPLINSLFGNLTNEGAVLHDWLYFTALVDRATADKILLEAMDLIPGLSGWRKKGIYWGLRMGGWKAWNDHRKMGHSLEYFLQKVV